MSLLTQTQLPPAGDQSDVPTVPIWRLSVEQYHAMIRAGIIIDDDPVELLEGWLVQKMGKKPPHSVVTGLVGDALNEIIPGGWHVKLQDPVTTDDSEPEPDISVVRGKLRDYLENHPAPNDTALIIEVTDTTLAKDRGIKKRVYARAGLAVYWIVNIPGRSIEVYTKPSGRGKKAAYDCERIYGDSEEIPVFIEGREVGRIKVSEVLP